jgi:flavin reductase (DIM6/NTAB) family NADH-FMN oxidoreductase RutF
MITSSILHSKDFSEMSTRYRANLFNSVMGFKSAVLVGTQSASCNDNLSIFSSLFHMGSKPALFGMLFRPAGEVPRHTLTNIEETGFYTLNNILPSFSEKAHKTSAKYAKEVSEFEACRLEKEYLKDFSAPFVKESTIRMGMKWLESVPIRHNNTVLVIGEVILVDLPSEYLLPDGMVDIEKAGTVTVSGLDSYHTTQRIARYEYARP